MKNPYGNDAALHVAESIAQQTGGEPPRVAIVLGSGLGALTEQITEAVTLPYASIPGFPTVTVPGHAGAAVSGRLAGVPVIALSGRFHLYEGHDVGLAAFPTRVVRAMGASTLVVTNAAGGIRRTFRPGMLMLIRDHLNMMFRNPLTGPVEQGDVRFPDMSDPYDPSLLAVAREVARERGVPVEEGVYAALLGPTYETPAESRMIERLGADAVGMSTVPEVVTARAMGMRVLGVSCITNMVAGISAHPITHDEVIETTAAASRNLCALVAGVCERL